MIYNRTYPQKNRLRRAQTSHFKKVILDISKKSRLVRKILYTIKTKKITLGRGDSDLRVIGFRTMKPKPRAGSAA